MPEEIQIRLDSSKQYPSPVYARPSNPEDYAWMLKPNGQLKSFIGLNTHEGEVHLLCPSGIGDVCWIWARYWKLQEDLKAQGRELIWHFPRDNTRRIHPYAKLVGMNVGEYLDMENFRDYGGEFEPQDFESGGVFYVHANRHIEEGNPLHKGAPKYDPDTNAKTWTEWLPFKNPAPPLTIVGAGDRPTQTSEGEGVWKYADPSMRKPYICVHVGSHLYGDGNWFPRKWAEMIKKIEEVAPVQLIGFGPTGEIPFIEKVISCYTPQMPAVIDRSFSTAMTRIVNSSGFVGIDDGLTILATYMGVPCLRAYPDWLHLMPGTFEDKTTLHPHNKSILMPELWEELGPWLEGLEVV